MVWGSLHYYNINVRCNAMPYVCRDGASSSVEWYTIATQNTRKLWRCDARQCAVACVWAFCFGKYIPGKTSASTAIIRFSYLLPSMTYGALLLYFIFVLIFNENNKPISILKENNWMISNELLDGGIFVSSTLDLGRSGNIERTHYVSAECVQWPRGSLFRCFNGQYRIKKII